ncbi:RapGAP/RanGAP domain containing protein [Acanthamoeba castellanii str. Neff]|uniref:RapGAP/RanGAP domain containing protein n=1 Tax=Acanthamoeba castellanii (strain ATCC 30010 / Neff) TaxID=1257118 RepID=L8GS93_ACACF|nr:RapGAP/RanGAP domain containing protein [Acanthamoeba castellanii str. Neff]ELR16049.1 RapGAP/RanGAP domain containing protein [Acanthamoeba castellanii str. Neff]
MEERKRSRGKSVDDGGDDEAELMESGERTVRKGTVRGATAKARTAIVSQAVGYRIEGGGLDADSQHPAASSSSSPAPGTIIDDVFDLEGKDNDYKFYQTKFFNQEHHNLLCKDSEIGPCCVSLIHSAAKGRYRALVRTPQGNRRMTVKDDDVKPAWWRKLFRMGPSLNEVVKTLDPALPANLRHIKADDLPAKILTIEEKQMIRGFKFGILYAKEGQTKEDEMFANAMENEALFKKGDEFKQFFYTKLLNAERASYCAPILGNKLTRTRTALLKDLAESYM